MKTHIFFHLGDIPPDMGQSQLTDDVKKFVEERKHLFPNYKFERRLGFLYKTRLTFDVATGDPENPTRRGFALLHIVRDDFQN